VRNEDSQLAPTKYPNLVPIVQHGLAIFGYEPNKSIVGGRSQVYQVASV
jgi:hypothetical protein